MIFSDFFVEIPGDRGLCKPYELPVAMRHVKTLCLTARVQRLQFVLKTIPLDLIDGTVDVATL